MGSVYGTESITSQTSIVCESPSWIYSCPHLNLTSSVSPVRHQMLVRILEKYGFKWSFLDFLQALLKETMEVFYWIIARISSHTAVTSC